MDDQMDDAGVCPGSASWLDVVAGTESSATGARLLAHAANCTDCAGRLREAIRIMADDQDQVEDRIVASLKSSQAEWQQQLAQRLARRVDPPFTELRSDRTNRRRWRFAAALAAAGIVLVMVGLAILGTRHQPSSSAKSHQIAGPAPSMAPATPGSPEQSHSSSETAQLEPRVVYLTLDAGTTRGQERQKQVQLYSATETLSLTLTDPPPGKLSLQLLNSKDEELWGKQGEVSKQPDKVTVAIPARGLLAGDYHIVVTYVTDEVKETVYYPFQVKP